MADQMDRLELEAADGRLVVTSSEAARFLRVHPQTLRQWRGRNDRPQPSGWNGRTHLYRLAQLRLFRDAGRPPGAEAGLVREHGREGEK